MPYVGYLLYWACTLYTFVLVGRIIFDLLMTLSRDWQPQGATLVIANLVYSLTDPPLRFIGKYVPPLRMGGVALDLGFILLFIGVRFVQNIAISFL